MVMATKFEVEVFNGNGDFLLWKKKMRDVLVQQKVARAIHQTYPTEDKKAEIDEIALSMIILHFFDNVLRKVDDMKTTTTMWAMLEELYLVKLSLDHILLLEQFIGFKWTLVET